MWWFNRYYSLYDPKRFMPGGLSIQNIRNFNRYKKEFYNIDNEYREHLYRYMMSSVVGDLNEDCNMFAFLFSAHENFNIVSSQLRHLNLKLTRNTKLHKLFKRVYKDMSCDLGTAVPNRDRVHNIENINHKQDQYLKDINYKTFYYSNPDEENNFEHIKNEIQLSSTRRRRSPFTTKPFQFNKPWEGPRRSLVLYFRRETLEETDFYWDHTIQMDYFEFGLICCALYDYIYNGYSNTFNDLRVVSRNPYIYPYFIHKLCPKLTYHNSRGSAFIEQTCVGANTVHLIHGTVPDNNTGTIPIYSNQMLLNDNRLNDKYVHLPLSYDKKNSQDCVDVNSEYIDIKKAYSIKDPVANHNIDSIIKCVISSVKELEHEIAK